MPASVEQQVYIQVGQIVGDKRIGSGEHNEARRIVVCEVILVLVIFLVLVLGVISLFVLGRKFFIWLIAIPCQVIRTGLWYRRWLGLREVPGSIPGCAERHQYPANRIIIV